MREGLRGVLSWATLVGACGAGCGSPAQPPPPAGGPLPPGAVARVGDAEVVTGATVGRIAAQQACDLAVALEKATFDAVLAAGARAEGLTGRRATALAVDRALAARLLADLHRDVTAAPIGDEELAAATQARWYEVDRPEGFATVHAVAMVAADASVEAHAAARALATRIAAAVVRVGERARTTPIPERSDELLLDFRARTRPRDPVVALFERAVVEATSGDPTVRIEALPFVAADGRIIDRQAGEGDSFAPEFAAAAAALPERGAVSPVVPSPHGYHVILLLEKVPAVRLTDAERRLRLGDLILQVRARRAERALLARLSDAARPEVATNAEALLELIAVGE
ncbi:MAG: hypothetical protein IT373_30170 [Polyangiaceae bacterium]|nr:hypothetical protein [Polyangiaceae bacterium]